MSSAASFKGLVDMQERSCERFADREFLGTKRGGEYTWIRYREFAEQVDRARAVLASLGVGAGDKVAVIANNRVEWAVAAYATYGLAAHYVPMYESQQPKDWAYILRDSGAKVLLAATPEVWDATCAMPDEIETLHHVLCFDAEGDVEHSWPRRLAAITPNVPSVQPGSDETAGLIYTSGTTGNPKGVVLSHDNFVSNVNAVHEVFPMSESDVSCSFLPWAHSFGQTCELHCLLSMGAAIGLAESPQTLMDDFLLVRPTLLFAVPRIFNRIYDGLQKRMADTKGIAKILFDRGMALAKQRRALEGQGRSSLIVDAQLGLIDRIVFSKVKARFGGRLRYVFSGGAALAKEVAEFIDDIGIMVFEGYGLTETSPIASANTPGARRLGTIGKAIPGVTIAICDEDGKEVPVDTDGEIVVIGPNVMQGYHGLPELTDEVIFDLDGKRAFRTGDMGRIGADGFVKITGRFKEQYKLENGKYVVPSPLEEQLKLSGLVSQAFVFGDNRPFNVCLVVPDFVALRRWAKDNGRGDSPAAGVADPLAHAGMGEELARYGREFKGYERPKRWALLTDEFTVDNDLLTPKMSVKRRNVIARYQAELDALYAETPAGK
ncbi:MAG: long-chain fatty acid--CoA ligase [Myxococcota bacterium]